MTFKTVCIFFLMVTGQRTALHCYLYRYRNWIEIDFFFHPGLEKEAHLNWIYSVFPHACFCTCFRVNLFMHWVHSIKYVHSGLLMVNRCDTVQHKCINLTWSDLLYTQIKTTWMRMHFWWWWCEKIFVVILNVIIHRINHTCDP